MNVLSAIGFWIAVLSPFVFSLAAFLDITRTPSWVWALTGRQRVLWMSAHWRNVSSLYHRLFGGMFLFCDRRTRTAKGLTR